MEQPKRKHTRLPRYDYSEPGVYFLTLCTKNRSRCLSKIVGRGLDPAVQRPGSPACSGERQRFAAGINPRPTKNRENALVGRGLDPAAQSSGSPACSGERQRFAAGMNPRPTENRENALVGRGLDPAVQSSGSPEIYYPVGYELELTPYGMIVEQELLALPRRYDAVELLQYVVMPDHLHILLQLAATPTAGRNPRPAVPTMIGLYKAGVSRKCKRALWQTSYYDHVVRCEQELLEIQRYIENNPLQWVLDGKA
ncbi:MAG TPA: transposase [Candidatus Gemmiger excrementavium]|uniref:Transposase n=1 Tax=Candidatus Gemmiger excrementavium TaxID=2838608 RepID=A0A9D2F169_9FIRM|nr:transposase [Candidatus Gemmiger excrementavium]